MDEQNIWIKVPNIPGLGLDGIAGKYIHATLDELNSLAGTGEQLESFFGANEEDTEVAMKIVELLVNTLDEEYLSIDKKDGNNVVTVDFSGDRFYTLIDKLVKDFIPELAKLIEENNYYEKLALTKEDVEKMKKINDDQEAMDEYKQGIDEMKKALTVSKGQAVQEINKDGFITNFKLITDLKVKDEEMGMNADLGIGFDQALTNINKDVEFTVAEPSQDEIIPLQELTPYIMGLMMGGY